MLQTVGAVSFDAKRPFSSACPARVRLICWGHGRGRRSKGILLAGLCLAVFPLPFPRPAVHPSRGRWPLSAPSGGLKGIARNPRPGVFVALSPWGGGAADSGRSPCVDVRVFLPHRHTLCESRVLAWSAARRKGDGGQTREVCLHPARSRPVGGSGKREVEPAREAGVASTAQRVARDVCTRIYLQALFDTCSTFVRHCMHARFGTCVCGPGAGG